jgi:RimJ/RimL family protein N-acetyltransferase
MSPPTRPYSMAELVTMHCETLYTFDRHGDMVSDNNPYPPKRRRCCRLHLGWNDETLAYRFRHDVPQDLRQHVIDWLESHSPVRSDYPSNLTRLGEIFGVAPDQIGIGPAYYAARDPSRAVGSVAITAANSHCLQSEYLKEGEIDFVQPLYAVVKDDRAVSTCVTVRRAHHSVEAGIDTQPDSRGQGYAGQATAAWIEAVRAAGLIPFYSTANNNIASQRVAAKLGLIQFAWELGIR